MSGAGSPSTVCPRSVPSSNSSFEVFHRGIAGRTYSGWLRADLCLKNPGGEVDLYVSVDLRSFARVWLGDLPFPEALRSGAIELTGRRNLARAFPSWLLLSTFADVPRPRAQAGRSVD